MKIDIFRQLLRNSLLALGSIFCFLLFFEFIVLIFFITPTDVARVEFKNGLIRYKANQSGITKLGNEFSSEFSINRDGWNSHHKTYPLAKSKKIRIAIIGDSYIAALEPGYKNAIPFLLEKELGSKYYEVYNFGIGGAHLAQYLHIFKNEVLKYDPSIIVFLIIHNDFAPSYKKDLMASGRYGQTFLTLPISKNGKIEVVPPRPYNPKWDKLLDLNSIRLLFYQYKLRTRFAYIKSLVLNKQYEMNIETSVSNTPLDKNKILANYVVSNIIDIAGKKGIKVIFMMNGDTQTIYNEPDTKSDSAPIRLNKMMRTVVEKNGAVFIDLHESFRKEYLNLHKKFEFKSDGHWNPYGQAVASKPLIAKIKEQLYATGHLN